jgi:plastocyanin
MQRPTGRDLGIVLGICAALVSATTAYAAEIRAKLVDEVGRPLKNAAIIAEPGKPAPAMTESVSATVDQIDTVYVPLATVVRTGTQIRFPNKDNIKHQVYSFSRAKKFELDLFTGKQAPPVIFDKPGHVTLGCNIHDWMLAHVLVVDTPYFAMTGDDGIALIKDLPADSYKVRVWHPGMKSRRKPPTFEVTVGADSKETIEHKLELLPASKWKRAKPDNYNSRG